METIREKMINHGLDAYVVSHGNRFIGQDILPQEHKIQKMCGFSGSSGILVVVKDTAYLLVDGRYELQARQQTDAKQVTVIDQMPRFKIVCDLLNEQGLTNIGYDAWCHSVAEMEFLKRKYRDMNFYNVGDWITADSTREVCIKERDVRYAGISRTDKLKIITDMLKEKQGDYFLFTSADSVSWLLNIYADDLPYSPIVRAYALVSKEGDITLVADNLQTDLPVKTWQEFGRFMQEQQDVTIFYDSHTMPEKILSLANETIKMHKSADMCLELKAVKNETELQGMIACHKRDGVALVKLLSWLENNRQGLSELDVVAKLHEFRAAQPLFYSDSFATIAASAENGAVVHYQPTENTNKPLIENSLFLLDSGGQYLDGTTDVTRTIAIGEPSQEMIDDYTTVLKAHIALAQARFPVGTAGMKLDAVARVQMWHKCLDYKHGTGHGVSCFGNVHEGPISVSAAGSEYGLQAGMVLSDEPGVYKEGKYGIRIENLQYTANVEQNPEFLEFKYLTKVPIDKHLINKYLLTEGERDWLNSYHQDVYDTLTPYLNSDERKWLKGACSPL